jgi:hypothetical protein
MQLVLILVLFLLVVGLPWVIRMGTGASKRKLTIVRAMRAVSIAILLLTGIPLVVLGILLVNESRGMDNGGDAFAAFGMGVTVACVGSFLCLVAGLALWAWSTKASREAAGSTFRRQGTDVYCKKRGFELIGPGGPCRKCDDVKTNPCSSCGRYILASDRTCPYCGADLT